MKDVSIHKDADVLTTDIGERTRIHRWVYIEEDVHIGYNCLIKPFVYIPDGTIIGNKVFIGMGVKICNDKYPVPNNYGFKLEGVTIEDCVCIGANATILPGVKIEHGATVGAGAVVADDVPIGVCVVGNPAKVVEYR